MRDAVTTGSAFSSTTRVGLAWDVLMAAITMAVGGIVPLRIGFGLDEWRTWIPFDAVVYFIFVVDTLLGIRRRCARGGTTRAAIWLLLDLASLVPVEFAALSMGRYHSVLAAPRLLRLPHLVPLWGRIQAQLGLGRWRPGGVCAAVAYSFLLATHLTACAFAFIVREDSEATSGLNETESEALAARYIRAFYWGLVALTGYSPMTPHSYGESALALVVAPLGLCLFIATVAAATFCFADADARDVAWETQCRDVDAFMAAHDVPMRLRADVRECRDFMRAIGALPEAPPSEAASRAAFDALRAAVARVPLFGGCADDAAFIDAVTRSLRRRVYIPDTALVRRGEVARTLVVILRGELNALARGNAVVGTLHAGDCFGDVGLIADFPSIATIVACSYCDVWMLSRRDLAAVLERHPQYAEAVRRAGAQLRAGASAALAEARRLAALADGGGDDEQGETEEEEEQEPPDA
jgi:CRP-like cAMP-binding protein